MKKKMYERPCIAVIAMETEPVMASESSVNTTGNPSDPGADIVDDGTMPGDDGTDLEKHNGQNTYSVWN